MKNNILGRCQDLYLYLRNNCKDISHLNLNYDENIPFCEIVGVINKSIVSFTYEIDDSLFVSYFGNKVNVDELVFLIKNYVSYEYVLIDNKKEGNVSSIVFTNSKRRFLDDKFANIFDENEPNISKNKVFKK